MDDFTQAGTFEGVGGSHRKRRRPSIGLNLDGGDGDGTGEPTCVRRHSSLPPLSLLARCALNRQSPSYSQASVGGLCAQQLQFPSESESIGFARSRPHQHYNSTNINADVLQLPGHVQQAQEDILPRRSSIQTIPPQLEGNTLLNQAAMRMQQSNSMLRQSQSLPQPALVSQYLKSAQTPSAAANGIAALPFGMSPQQLLNYAVLVNIINNSSSSQPQENAAIPSRQFNFSQATAQPQINTQAGGSTSNCSATIPSPPLQLETQQQGHDQYQHLAKLNQDNQNDRNDSVNYGCGNDDPIRPKETEQLAEPNQSPIAIGRLNDSLPADETCTDGVYCGTASADSLNAKTNSVPKRNESIPTVLKDVPSRSGVPLWTPEDEDRLSTQQCWLRKQIETFPASARDVRTRGRNRLLDLGQVGIQCIHCKNLSEGRGVGSSYFPASIKSIYQSAQNMLTFHFKEDTCPLIPRRLLQQMRDAGEASVICPRMAPKAGKSRAGSGKSFWERAAKNTTGLVDTTVGIRYAKDIENYRPLESIALGTAEGELDQNTADVFQADDSVLTRRNDKGKVTDFCFILMSQFGPYCTQSSHNSDLLDGDGWGSDIENEESLPSIGVVCKHCNGASKDGKQPKGIFLSSKADTMMRNKNLARMYNHLLECAPEDLKSKLMQAKNIHLPQSDRLKKGWKKHFFEDVCDRLHESL